MILNAHFGKRWYNADTAEEISALISRLIVTLKHEHPVGIVTHPGDDALLCFAEERFDHYLRTAKDAKGHLLVAVNMETGYGALMWYQSGDSQVWVSDNPEPPNVDPRVVSDPGYPLFHDPASTLPVKQFREAVEEFCYSGTGDRPACIRWVRSDVCGRREDRENSWDQLWRLPPMSRPDCGRNWPRQSAPGERNRAAPSASSPSGPG